MSQDMFALIVPSHTNTSEPLNGLKPGDNVVIKEINRWVDGSIDDGIDQALAKTEMSNPVICFERIKDENLNEKTPTATNIRFINNYRSSSVNRFLWGLSRRSFVYM